MGWLYDPVTSVAFIADDPLSRPAKASKLSQIIWIRDKTGQVVGYAIARHPAYDEGLADPVDFWPAATIPASEAISSNLDKTWSPVAIAGAVP